MKIKNKLNDFLNDKISFTLISIKKQKLHNMTAKKTSFIFIDFKLQNSAFASISTASTSLSFVSLSKRADS